MKPQLPSQVSSDTWLIVFTRSSGPVERQLVKYQLPVNAAYVPAYDAAAAASAPAATRAANAPAITEIAVENEITEQNAAFQGRQPTL